MGKMKDEWTKQMERDDGDNRTRLRDTFAAAALTGLLANDDLCAGDDKLSCMAYQIADAMLCERNGAVEGCETVCPHVRGTVTQHCSLNFTLTDAEREAIETAVRWLEPYPQCAGTLRKLLERLK